MLVPVLVFVIVLSTVLAVGQWRGWVDLRGKGRAAGGVFLGGMEDVFAPSAQEARTFREEEQIQVVARPAPGDPHRETQPQISDPTHVPDFG